MNTLLKRIFKNELLQLNNEVLECKRVKDQLITQLNHSKKVNDRLQEVSNEYIKSLNDEIESHMGDLENMRQYIELQKMYCYIIPRLINSSGIELPEDFDITDFSHAEKLYKRFRSGDLMGY